MNNEKQYFTNINGYYVKDEETSQDMSTLSTRVSSLETDNTTNKSDITDLKTRMTTAESDIDALEGNVTTMQGNVNTLQGSVNTLEEINNYSTSEKVIGSWIDNRPVYRKTIFISSLPATSEDGVSNVTVSTGITGLDIPINLYGMYYDTNKSGASFKISNSYNFNANRVIDTRISGDGTTITVSTNGEYNFTSYAGYVTVDYVKTSE